MAAQVQWHVHSMQQQPMQACRIPRLVLHLVQATPPQVPVLLPKPQRLVLRAILLSNPLGARTLLHPMHLVPTQQCLIRSRMARMHTCQQHRKKLSCRIFKDRCTSNHLCMMP